MHDRLIIIASILMFSFSTILSQNLISINGLLLDQRTKAPISNAFISLANSTISVNSDDSGQFAVSQTSLVGREILISHSEYEDVRIKLPMYSSAKDTFLLEPIKPFVDDKFLQKLNRKKAIQLFEKDIFGDGKASRKLSIQNPEVIRFEETADGLFAFSDDLIKIRNEFLAYEIYYSLENYKHADSLHIHNGVVSFADISNDEAVYFKRRAKLRKQDKESFFRNLLHDNLNELDIEIKLSDESLSEVLKSTSLLYRTTVNDVFAIY